MGGRLLTLEGQVVDLEALVSALGSGDDGGIADQGVVDTRVRDQVGLELVQVHVQGAVEAERRGDGGDDLSDQAVEVLVVGAGDVQVAAADVVDSLVVDEESAVRVLDGAVGGENGVVGLNNGGRDAGGRVDGELELGLLSVVGRQALEKKSTEAGTGTATEGVEDQETLEGAAVVYHEKGRPVSFLLLLRDWVRGDMIAVARLPATRRTRSMTLSTISLPMV